jgi:hypothetical protein
MAPKSYRCKFIEPGIISYTDSDQGTVLVSKDALDRMAATFRNCPVIFVPEHHNDADKENAFNFYDTSANPASGIVAGIPYWGDDGWQYVDISVWDEEAQRAIESGFSVSCAYEVDETGEAGEWHQIPYDQEITNGHYLHMAIVPRPRYEGSQILANSKGGHNMALFGIKPKSKENAIPPAVVEKKPDEGKKMLNDDATIDVDGVQVPVHEMISLAEEYLGIGTQAPKDEDQLSLSDGSTKTVAELKEIYRKASASVGEEAEPAEPAMENAEAPTDTPAEDPNDPKKMNNAAPAKKTVNTALRNAALNPDGEHPGRGIETEANRLERGKNRYTIPVKNGGTK